MNDLSPTSTVGDSVYESGLDKRRANFMPLTPLSFLPRAAHILPDKPAVVHGPLRYTYAQFYERCRRQASALKKHGIRAGDTVSIMAPNIPAMLESFYGTPMAGAVLNALNIRLDAAGIAFCLNHGGAKLLFTDTEFYPVIEKALPLVDHDIIVIDIDDPVATGDRKRLGKIEYEAFLAEGDPDEDWRLPEDEWEAINLLYTSGTTGDPKGVVYHHRGAYLNSFGNALFFGLNQDSRYLWTLPMFHCSGWCFTWAVTAQLGTHVCLRKVDPALIFPLIAEHRVTHMCGAPIVLNALVHAPDDIKPKLDYWVKIATGGAAPPSIVIERMEAMGFEVTHLYGSTEVYGPAVGCVVKDEWQGLPVTERAGYMARQGVQFACLEGLMVANPETLEPVTRDGKTIGEVMMRGNIVMKGYLKNPAATERTLSGGWYHSGDLAVCHPDGYIEIKDRSKDIIISGGENISSLEVEETLYKHPSIMECAVVAWPDQKWGEVPCAFVTLNPSAPDVTEDEIIAWSKENMARYKVPKKVVFGPLPKTSTGKIQKFVLRSQAKDDAR